MATKILLQLSILIIPLFCLATELPQSTGLPEALPYDFIKTQMMVAFEQTADTFHAPIAAKVIINGKPIPPRDTASLGVIFAEYFFASLPKGQPIQILEQGNLQKVWNYPVGTNIVHLIVFKTQPIQIFEMRLEQKMKSGQWAFGLYTPSKAGLQLNHYSGIKPESFDVALTSGQNVKVELSHLNLESCRGCHFMNSPSKYQYPSVTVAGPCGFGPANQDLTVDWANRYFKLRHENPFR